MKEVRKRGVLGNRKGQSAIEFIVVVVVVLFFLMFCLSLSVLFMVSDYVEYATFMSARTYKSMFFTPDSQKRNAQIVFNSYIDRIQGLARNFNLNFIDAQPGDPQNAGVSVTYDIDLFYLPPLFIPNGIPGSSITLTTETRLGRDITNVECNEYFRQLSSRLGMGFENNPTLLRQMDDNGC